MSRARDYLMSVFEDREEEIGNRMDALRISRKTEAKRRRPSTSLGAKKWTARRRGAITRCGKGDES